MSELGIIYLVLWLVGCAIIGWNSNKLAPGLLAMTIIAGAIAIKSVEIKSECNPTNEQEIK